MIVAMLNLRCSNGHRFYAPEPEQWENKTCGPHSGTYRCEGTLHPESKSEAKTMTDPTRLATEGRALPYMGRRRLDQGDDLAG